MSKKKPVKRAKPAPVQSNRIFPSSPKAPQATSDSKATKTARANDGFQNFAARLGVGPGSNCGTEDNLISKGHYEFNYVTRNRLQLEAAYRGAWIVGQVIDTVSEDMTRAGIEITTSEDAEELDEIHTAMSRLQIWKSLEFNQKWGRLYGGAIAVLQIEGQKLDTPLDPETIKEGQFQGLTVYDRWQLNPDLTDLIDSGPELGLPKYYAIVLSNLNNAQDGPTTEGSNLGQVRVHHSRCIRATGIDLPFWQAITEMLWGESVLERMWDRLIAFDTATMATGNLINRAQLRTVGVEGLREILGAGGPAQEALLAQFDMMRQLQSNEGITLLDKEDTFASTAYSFAGVSDVIIQQGQQVSGAAQIPLVRLFGQSPAGMNATGDSDIRLYYDSINAKQESTMRNPMEKILKVLWRSVLGKSTPKDLSFVFTPLWQMSAIDKANIAKTNAETVVTVHDAGGVDTATMMKELRQSSGDTGLFTHITDEQIKDAENEEPPMPEESPIDPSGELKPEQDPKEIIKAKAGDSAWKKIKAWLSAT